MASSTYWQNRIQDKTNKIVADIENKAEKDLAKAYYEQAKEIEAEVLKVFSKIQADKLTDDGILPNDLYRTHRYYELLDYLNQKLKELGLKQIQITEEELIEVYLQSQEMIDKEAPTSVLQQSAFLNTESINVKEIVHTAWCLDGKEFSNRVWDDKDALLKSYKKHMVDYVTQGKSPYEIARRIAKDTGANINNAYRLARTETAHIQNKAAIDKYKSMGYTHGIFSAASSCCSHCQEKDGERFLLSELEHVLPAHPNCRCTFTLDTERG